MTSIENIRQFILTAESGAAELGKQTVTPKTKSCRAQTRPSPARFVKGIVSIVAKIDNAKSSVSWSFHKSFLQGRSWRNYILELLWTSAYLWTVAKRIWTHWTYYIAKTFFLCQRTTRTQFWDVGLGVYALGLVYIETPTLPPFLPPTL